MLGLNSLVSSRRNPVIYHMGLRREPNSHLDGVSFFFFDAQFPPTYPAAPPVSKLFSTPNIRYLSRRLRRQGRRRCMTSLRLSVLRARREGRGSMNGGRSDSLRAQLSEFLYQQLHLLRLLLSWQGKGCEKLNLAHSTMLQVLMSIQALVLNNKPYFNEPEYERSSGTQEGAPKSLKYNERTFFLSVRTMLYSLRRQPKNLVAEHFRIRGRTILAACKAYMDSVQVGCDMKDEDDDVKDKDADDGEGGQSAMSVIMTFTHSVEKLFDDFLMEFTVKGADCAKFLAQKVIS